jgi:hypothetical protein
MMSIREYLLINKFKLLFVVFVAYFLCSTFLESPQTQYLFSLVFAFVMMACLLVVSEAKILLRVAALIFILSLSLILLRGFSNWDHSLRLAQEGLDIVFFILISAASAYATFQYEKVDAQTLFGALCTYLLLGITWAQIYMFIYALDPHSFSFGPDQSLTQNLQQTFIYYSYVTLSTLGYGDITSISAPAHTFSWSEAITGQAYLAILIAELVGQHIAQKKG